MTKKLSTTQRTLADITGVILGGLAMTTLLASCGSSHIDDIMTDGERSCIESQQEYEADWEELNGNLNGADRSKYQWNEERGECMVTVGVQGSLIIMPAPPAPSPVDDSLPPFEPSPVPPLETQLPA